MTTNAGIVSDALKYVTQKTEQLNTLQKLDERIDNQNQNQNQNESNQKNKKYNSQRE